jgi:PAS domain S-box-containing protein
MSSEPTAPTPPEDERAASAAEHEARLLYQLSLDLCSAATPQDAIAAMARPWASAGTGTVTATLSTLELDAQGVPEWINVVARWPQQETPAGGWPRYYVPDLPTSQLWLHSPEVQLLIDDIETDERVDANARQIMGRNQMRAAILMPITLQGRWVGYVSLGFPAPRRFTDVDRRTCQALAKLAALVLDNRLLLDRMQKALQDNRRQRQALETIMDNLPVGVMVTEMPSGRMVLQNRETTRILGQDFLDQSLLEPSHRRYRILRPGTDELMPPAGLPMTRMRESGTWERGEVEVQHPDGTRVAVECTAVPIRDESGVMSSGVLVLNDLTGRKQTAEDQRRMQDELIRVQAAALAERSMPLIPITDDILVLPLIGSLDTERSDQLLDALLDGVSKNRTRVAIIDVTGVRTLDTQAARALTNAAQAVRLLGVEPVVTGIRAEVAQTLVGLGVPLTDLVTRSTLQSGIAYAQKRQGKQPSDGGQSAR